MNRKLSLEGTIWRAALRPVVITCEDGEYRVPGPDGTEAQAYYTDDRDDAVGTAKAMHGAFRTIKFAA